MRTFLALAVIAASTVGFAPAASAAAPAVACGPATPAALAEFFDSRLPDRLQRTKVPGAVVSVVSGDQTVFSRGYGVADAGRGTAMDPDRSLVRVASISKLFTWTAVMQQVQAGRIDLGTDVNHYLDFRIPATYPQPITVVDLMNHTAGFEHFVIGTGARSAKDVKPLGQYLQDAMPQRIRPPGQISAYSNYGAGLAGYIVSRVSGESYESYVQHHLLDPLGMTHTTAAEPIPAPLAADLAASYDSDTGHRIPFIFDQMPPDGSISTTANDMARFMAAHLNDGRGILDPATATLMHTRSYNADPRLNGYAHGFMDRTVNGHRVLAHDGSWEGFLSTMFLIPDCHLGLFVSTNGTGGVDALTDVIAAFFDQFAPGAPTLSAGAAAPLSPAAPRAGFYALARHNESTVARVLMLVGPLRLTITGGTIHFGGKDWTSAGDGLYQSADGRDHLVFLTGTPNAHYIATDGPAYQLMATTDTLPVNLGVLLAFTVTTLSALIVMLVSVWRRRTLSRSWRWARRLSAAASLAGLVFLGLLTAIVFGDTSEYLYGTPLSFRLLLLLPIAALVVAAAAAGLTVRGWRSAGMAARIHQIAVLVGLAAFAWFVTTWNLL